MRCQSESSRCKVCKREVRTRSVAKVKFEECMGEEKNGYRWGVDKRVNTVKSSFELMFYFLKNKNENLFLKYSTRMGLGLSRLIKTLFI